MLQYMQAAPYMLEVAIQFLLLGIKFSGGFG